MKTIIPLAVALSLLSACVAPPSLINTNTALYPGYFPVYAPQIQLPRIPVIASASPIATTAIGSIASKAPITRLPQTVPAAYGTGVRTSIQPLTLNAPVLAPVLSNNKNPVTHSIPQAKPYAAAKPTTIPAPAITTHTAQAQNLNQVAQRIFRNQTSGDTKRLIRWNERENFATLGIGQFIWYPAGKSGRYNQTFPAYLNYVKANRVPLPTWLARRPNHSNPWPNAAAFRQAQNDRQAQELQNFLQKTLNLQANFMALRLKQSMPSLLNRLSPHERQKAQRSYQTLLKTPGGLYPLLDYVQFQGTGANPAERYNGKGWGLLQVLTNMEQVQTGPGALAEFMRAADDTLVTRIANAPSDRREARLLDGWLERVNTYRPQQRAALSYKK